MSSGRLFLIGLLASTSRLRFTGDRSITCTSRTARQRGHFYFAQEGDISTLLTRDLPGSPALTRGAGVYRLSTVREGERT